MESAEKETHNIIDKNEQLQFTWFPGFAAYLLNNRLEDYIIETLRLSKEVKFPLLKYFDFMSDEKLIELSRPVYIDYFTHIIEGRLSEYVKNSLDKWKNDQLPLMSREQLVVEDITLVSYVRKKAFLKFLPDYISDSKQQLQIIREIDDYILKVETESLNTYIKIQQASLDSINQNLIKNQQQLLEAQELAQLGSFEWGLEGNNSYYSPQCIKILELTELGTLSDFMQYVHPDDEAAVKAALDKAFAGNGHYESEYRYRKHGAEKVIWARGQVVFQGGQPQVLRGTVIDVTDRYKMQERLYQTEQRYFEMINEIQDYGIILLSKDGIIENWNLGAEKIKGYKAEEIIGKHLRTFYRQEDRNARLPEKLIAEAVLKGRSVHEGLRVRKDGSLFWASVVITALHDKNGKVTGLSKLTRDLTEKKNADDAILNYSRQLEQKNEDLKKLNKELESFSYIASHDLQEPLRNINMFVNMLIEKEEEHLTDKGKQFVAKVIAATARMQNLIKDLLLFSRMQPSEDQLAEVDLNSILEEVKSSYNEAIEAKNLTIDWDKLPVVNAVPFQMRQLFDNIINNSVKYGRENIPVEIHIHYKLADGTDIESDGINKQKKYHQISITDNGIGFEQKQALRIFDLFQRLHGKSEYSGTGIGLAICKKILQNHGGAIYAQAKPNEGATFFVSLPA